MNTYFFILHFVLVVSVLFVALLRGKEALTAFVAACWLFANFFVNKEIILFGLEVTASDVYAVGGMLAVAVLQEYWGQTVAKNAVWSAFIVLIFACAASFLHLSYLPSPNDSSQEAFVRLLSPAPRLIAASLFTFFFVQKLEIVLLQFVQRLTKLPFFLRAGCTIGILQIVDTTLFAFLGLYGNVHAIFDVILFSTCMKPIIVILSTPFLALCQFCIPSNNKSTTYSS